MTEKNKARGIQSIDIAGRILAVLGHASKPMKLKQLADQTALSSAQIHSYLTSLKRAELVSQNWETGLYQLGSMAVRLGLVRMKSDKPLSMARKILQEIETKLGFLCFMAVMIDDKLTIMQIARGNYPLNINLTEGMSLSFTKSAVGRVFSPLYKTCWQNEMQQLPFDYNNVRHIYEFSIDEPVPMLNSLAVPYFNPMGGVVCGFEVVASAQYLNLENLQQQLDIIDGIIMRYMDEDNDNDAIY